MKLSLYTLLIALPLILSACGAKEKPTANESFISASQMDEFQGQFSTHEAQLKAVGIELTITRNVETEDLSTMSLKLLEGDFKAVDRKEELEDFSEFLSESLKNYKGKLYQRKGQNVPVISEESATVINAALEQIDQLIEELETKINSVT